MEQSPANSCANCASPAPADESYQRCSRCKQVSHCSRDCQKRHWKQHKQSCRPQNNALAFLQDEPFPDLNLSIDGLPVAVVDTGRFDEETDKQELTPARAVSTILWNWHPNALRAFLDCQKYTDFDFGIIDDYAGSEKVITHIISRRDRAIVVGYYDQNRNWGHQANYDILEDGRWKPLWASENYIGNRRPEYVDMMGRSWAKDHMYHRRWEPKDKRTFKLLLNRSIVDPALLY